MINEYFKNKIALIDNWFDSELCSESQYPEVIHDAMRYMVFGGGKRVRPILSIASAAACGADDDVVKYPALAVELIHTYSLVHDDLPCMDNDDYRRGKETCHKKYGEANAVLTGDALLTYAFELLSKMSPNPSSMRIIRELSSAAGSLGMIGGQVVDKLSEGTEPTQELLDYINIHKTGKLLMVSCLNGAIAAGASTDDEAAIVRYGECLGFAFQIIDDILDNDGYLRFMSKHEAYERAKELIEEAKKCASRFGDKGIVLSAIADFVLNRDK